MLRTEYHRGSLGRLLPLDSPDSISDEPGPVHTWHLFQVTVGGHAYSEYMAQGNGGQLVMVVPELDLAVLVTAGNYGNFPTWRKVFEDLMPQFIIPAALH